MGINRQAPKPPTRNYGSTADSLKQKLSIADQLMIKYEVLEANRVKNGEKPQRNLNTYPQIVATITTLRAEINAIDTDQPLDAQYTTRLITRLTKLQRSLRGQLKK